AATTWATSWVDAPIHMPAISSGMPNKLPKDGTSGIIRVPNSTTKAMAVATSSSLASVVPSAAATAAAPQIENPQAMSTRWAKLMPIRCPAHRDPKNVTVTETSTTAKTPKPRSRIDDKDSCNPSRTIPVRKSCLDEKATPSDMAVRSEEHTSELQSRFDLVCRP